MVATRGRGGSAVKVTRRNKRTLDDDGEQRTKSKDAKKGKAPPAKKSRTQSTKATATTAAATATGRAVSTTPRKQRGSAPASPPRSPPTPSLSPTVAVSQTKPAPQSILKKKRPRGGDDDDAGERKGLSWRDTSGSPICDYSDPPAHCPFTKWSIDSDGDSDDDDEDDEDDDYDFDERDEEDDFSSDDSDEATDSDSDDADDGDDLLLGRGPRKGKKSGWARKRQARHAGHNQKRSSVIRISFVCAAGLAAAAACAWL